MTKTSQIKIQDITKVNEHQEFLYRCFAPMPFRRYTNRQEYLDKAISGGFHKKVLFFKGEAVGQVEYAPAIVSGYPITGDNIIVMNCIWVLRKARGHNFGTMLVDDMMKSEKDAVGFASVALQDHWSPWFKKVNIERLGFRSIDSIRVRHKMKRKDHFFNINLMWMPKTESARPPIWDNEKMLEGETFCIAHPLYRPQTCRGAIFATK